MEIPFAASILVRKTLVPNLERSGVAGKAEIIPYAGPIRKYARIGPL